MSFKSSSARHLLTLELFKRDWLTANYFREPYKLSNMMEAYLIERADTDGFICLDLYGEKAHEWLHIVNRSSEVNGAPLEVFKRPAEFLVAVPGTF